MSENDPTVTFNDFSGGITDNPVSNELNKFEELDNVLITDANKAKSRWGSQVIDATDNRVPLDSAPTAQKVSAVINYKNDDTLFISSARHLYKDLPKVANELLGPVDTNEAFSVATEAAHVSSAEWKNQLFLTNDEDALPIQVYKNGSDAWTLQTAGMPKIAETLNYDPTTALNAAYALANNLQTKLLAHIADFAASGDLEIVTGDTHGTTTVDNIADTSDIAVGDHVIALTNSDIPVSATVLSIGANSVVLSIAATGTNAGGTIMFGRSHLNEDTVAKALIFTTPIANSLASLLVLTNALKNAYSKHIGIAYDEILTAPAAPVHPLAVGLFEEYYYGSSLAAPSRPRLKVARLATAYESQLTSIYGSDLYLPDGSSTANDLHPSGAWTAIAASDWEGIRRTVAAPADATTLAGACKILDNLKIAYNLHERSGSHLFANYNQATSPSIGAVNAGPTIAADWSDLYDYANALKSAIDDHITDSLSHYEIVRDLPPGIQAADATTKETLCELAWEIGYRTWAHIYEASFEIFTLVGTSLNTSADVTITSGDIIGLVGGMLMRESNVRFPQGTILNTFTTGQISMSSVASATTAGLTFKLSFNMNHYAADATVPPNVWGRFNFESPHSVLEFLQSCHTAMQSHMQAEAVHGGSTPLAETETLVAEAPVAYLFGYKLLYRYDFTVGSLDFTDRGPVTFREVEAARLISSPQALTTLPALTNGSTGNYDTANIKLEIYRTLDDESVYHLAKSVACTVTSAEDDIKDEVLADAELLYTEGGVVENYPPQGKYVHIIGDIAMWANIKDGDEELPFQARQSVPGAPYSAPQTFSVDVDNDILGVTSAQGKFMLGTGSSIYRLEGSYDQTGQGFIRADKIANSVGMASHQSCVVVDEGCYFAGTDGFYFTNGFNCQKISGDFNTTYQTLVSTVDKARNIVGTLDPLNNEIHWACRQASGDGANDSTFIYNLKKKAFTTASGSASYAPTAICFFDKQLIRGDSRGYVFKHDPSYTSDPVVDVNVAASLWATRHRHVTVKTVATDCGLPNTKKWGGKVTVHAENEGDLGVQLSSINDRSTEAQALRPIRAIVDVTWGDPLINWDDPEVYWNAKEDFKETRRFPSAGGLRFKTKQIQLESAKLAVWNSDNAGTATVDGAANTVTLDDSATYDWPTDCVGHVIAFAGDDYVTEYEITARAANVLTVADAGNVLPSAAATAWVIRGYPKDMTLHLTGIEFTYKPLTGFNPGFQGGNQGDKS